VHSHRFHALILCLLTLAAAGEPTPLAAQLPDSPSSSIAQSALIGSPSLPQASGGTSAPSHSGGQSAARRLFQRGLQDQKEIYTLPLQRKNLKWTALFLAGTGGLIAADRHISGGISPDHADISRAISDAGLYSLIGTVGVIGLSGWKSGDARARETAVLGGEASANAAVVLLLTQLITGRQRPLEGNGNGDFLKNNSPGSSFPSGHSTFSWTLASVVAHEYPKPWVSALAYGTATTVSITRVTGLKHFSADVAVGAVFGYFIGQHIFHAHACSDCRSSEKGVPVHPELRACKQM
jgi:membrane-associated phospholipid phosphatase